MAHRNKPLLEKVEITAIGSEGKALGRVGGKVVFVPMLAPGDIVDVQVTRKRKKFMEGFAVKFHKYSDLRQDPVCRHFGTCGGCKWQHLPYKKQVEFKQQQVFDNFSRIGKFPFPDMNPIIGSHKDFFYRNKLEFTFSDNRWLTREEIETGNEVEKRYALGFHISGMFDKILDIEYCYLQDSISNEIRNSIREYAVKNNLEFFSLKQQSGFLRTLIIRTTLDGQIMVIITFYHEDTHKRRALLDHIISGFPQISSLMYVINTKPHDSIGDLDVLLYSGADHLIEEMEKMKFKIGPKSFYQTNTDQAYELYKIVRSYAGLSGQETVYDLYTGTGTIANFISSNAGRVIGIEYVPEAMNDALVNTSINGIENCRFFVGDIKEILNEDFVSEHGRPDVIITDPPRAGMHEKVTRAILDIEPSRIVYVSCNPATQARDIALLSEKYHVKEVQPVDMFPQTHHVECVVLLILDG
ncbi:MAG TPA: 23S rRNA (uracil(1939)-C(5))-methyltransferase RlmD [Bacteroidales bacterium]|nr:23S rRNA (uracil(1939)-C(5))-methyltransferase RlmD [Bacteroidales bacterium]